MKHININSSSISVNTKTVFVVLYVLFAMGLVAFRGVEQSKINQSLGSDFGDTPSPLPGASDGDTYSRPEKMLISPSVDNFNEVGDALSKALNQVSILQEDGTTFDPTDLEENFSDFSAAKYEEVVKGERNYKYLHLEPYWTDNVQKIQAKVVVPDSPNGQDAQEYVELVLQHLNTKGISTANVSVEEIKVIARDVSEIGRFTCIKFLRLAWAIFSEKKEDMKGIFPQVYQIRLVDAGDLSSQVEGGIDLFDGNHQNVVRSSSLRNANISNVDPETRVALFDKKVVVFFRPTAKSVSQLDNGHVGISKLDAQYDEAGNFKNFLISALEVNGVTGQAFYSRSMEMQDFRSHLYFNSDHAISGNKQVVGWYFNR